MPIGNSMPLECVVKNECACSGKSFQNTNSSCVHQYATQFKLRASICNEQHQFSILWLMDHRVGIVMEDLVPPSERPAVQSRLRA